MIAEAPSPLAGARVLFTGVTGFVGAQLVRRVLDLGAEPVAFVRAGGGDRWRVSEVERRIEWREVDLMDGVAVREAVAETRPDIVYHLAAYYAVDSRGVDPGEVCDVNVKAGLLLLDACRELSGLRLFVNVGTCAEFGDLRTQADEESPVRPNSLYAATKAASVVVMRQHAEETGVPMTTLRLYNMYGPFEKPSRIVPHVALSLLRGERVSLTAGEQAKDYTYVADVADAFVAAAERPHAAAGEVFNVGSGITVTMRDLICEITKHFEGGEADLGWGDVPYRDNEMWFQGTSNAKARAALGWTPRHDLASGIAETVTWYRDNRGLYER